MRGDMGRSGEIWGDPGERSGEIGRDLGRSGVALFSVTLKTIFLKPRRPRTAFHMPLRKHHHMM